MRPKSSPSVTAPSWLVAGRTILLLKDPSKGSEASNYRPVASLNLLWKILSGIFAQKVYKHLEDNDLLPIEQKGRTKRTRGTKDHLMLDKAIFKNCKRRKTNLAKAWVDFKKAYDMAQHSWILETLSMFGIAVNITQLLQNSMPLWKTQLYHGQETLELLT